jgi:hypothetical protein
LGSFDKFYYAFIAEIKKSMKIPLELLELLTLILLKWKISGAPNNVSKWQIGFNSAFKGLNLDGQTDRKIERETLWR